MLPQLQQSILSFLALITLSENFDGDDDGV